MVDVSQSKQRRTGISSYVRLVKTAYSSSEVMFTFTLLASLYDYVADGTVMMID